MSFFPKPLMLAVAIAAGAIAAAPAPTSPVSPPVEMRYCGLRPGRPPLKYMSFDITLHNSADKQQWFLLPASLYEKPAGGRKEAGINAIELFSDPQEQVIVVHFLGTMHLQPQGAGGFKGLLLPPGATVSVHGFGISFWGEPVSPLALKIVMADQVTIAGTPLEQWVGKPLLSAKTADVKELQPSGSKSSDDSKELRVEIKKSGEFAVADALAQSCAAQ